MNYIPFQIDSYAVAAAAAATPPTLVGYHHNPLASASMQPLLTRTTMASNNNNHNQHDVIRRTMNQMTNELVMAQKYNKSMQHELAMKTNEANELMIKLRYFAENQIGLSALQNDSVILKETIDALEARSRAQAGEITRLRIELHSHNNSNDEEARKPPPTAQGSNATNHRDHTVPQQQRKTCIQDIDKAVMRSWLFKHKSGCPLCLTRDHTLLNCDLLQSNGYLVTYHSVSDTQNRYTTSNPNYPQTPNHSKDHYSNQPSKDYYSNQPSANIARSNNALCLPNEAGPQSQSPSSNEPPPAWPLGSDGLGRGNENHSGNPPPPTHCQEVIELLDSDSDNSDAEKERCDTRNDLEATRTVAEGALHKTDPNEGIQIPAAATAVTNAISSRFSREDTGENPARALEQRHPESIRNSLEHRTVLDNDENDYHDGDGDCDEQNGTATEEPGTNDDDADYDDYDEEEEVVGCGNYDVGTDAILADVPMSVDLGHQLQGNSRFASINDRIEDGRGGKNRPIAIDVLEEEEPIVKGTSLNAESQREQQEKLGLKYKSNGGMMDTNIDAEKNNDEEEGDDDEEIKFIGETGKNALSDFPHPRYDCVMKPFAKGPEAFCSNCYCYVCDVKASECEKWKISGEHEEDSHCYAERRVLKWKRRRLSVRSKRKRPERILKNIAIFLHDTVPSKLPPKRKKREMVRYGQPGYESNNDVQRAMRTRQGRKNDL